MRRKADPGGDPVAEIPTRSTATTCSPARLGGRPRAPDDLDDASSDKARFRRRTSPPPTCQPASEEAVRRNPQRPDGNQPESVITTPRQRDPKAISGPDPYRRPTAVAVVRPYPQQVSTLRRPRLRFGNRQEMARPTAASAAPRPSREHERSAPSMDCRKRENARTSGSRRSAQLDGHKISRRSAAGDAVTPAEEVRAQQQVAEMGNGHETPKPMQNEKRTTDTGQGDSAASTAPRSHPVPNDRFSHLSVFLLFMSQVASPNASAPGPWRREAPAD